MNKVEKQMRDRLSKGLDPLTGELRETVGKISCVSGICKDSTGEEVELNSKGTWIYKN